MTYEYIAECQQCAPIKQRPFDNGQDRDQWADEHATTTGHKVETWIEEVGPDEHVE